MFTLTGQDQHGVMIKSVPKERIAGWHENDNVIAAHMGDKKRSTVGECVYYKPTGIMGALETDGAKVIQSDMGVIIQKSQDYRENGSLRTFNQCPTSRSNMGDNHPMLKLQTRIRRLTPIECEKLQGFPINHTAEGINDKGQVYKVSDSQRYKMCGNAVTVDIVAMITKAIKENI